MDGRWIRRASAVAAVAIACSISGDAHADEPTEPAPAPAPVTERHWYGWQLLIVDASAVGVVAAAGAAESGLVGVFGVAAYAFGPPVIHAVHGRPLAALGSLGLRIGAPVVFGLIGQQLDGERSWAGDGAGGLLLGGLTGIVTAMAVDAAAIAWEDVAVRSVTTSSR